MDQLWLADVDTRAYYPKLIGFVHTWERYLAGGGMEKNRGERQKAQQTLGFQTPTGGDSPCKPSLD